MKKQMSRCATDLLATSIIMHMSDSLYSTGSPPMVCFIMKRGPHQTKSNAANVFWTQQLRSASYNWHSKKTVKAPFFFFQFFLLGLLLSFIFSVHCVANQQKNMLPKPAEGILDHISMLKLSQMHCQLQQNQRSTRIFSRNYLKRSLMIIQKWILTFHL